MSSYPYAYPGFSNTIENLRQTAGMLKSFFISNNLNIAIYVTVNQTINLGMSLHGITKLCTYNQYSKLQMKDKKTIELYQTLHPTLTWICHQAQILLQPVLCQTQSISPIDYLSSPISPANSFPFSNNIAISLSQRQELERLHTRITLQDSGIVIMHSSAHSLIVYQVNLNSQMIIVQHLVCGTTSCIFVLY